MHKPITLKIISLFLLVISVYGFAHFISITPTVSDVASSSKLTLIVKFYISFAFVFLSIISLNLERIVKGKFVLNKFFIALWVIPLTALFLVPVFWMYNVIPNIPVILIDNSKVLTTFISSLLAQALINSLFNFPLKPNLLEKRTCD